MMDVDISTLRQSMLQYEQEVEVLEREIQTHNQIIQQLLLQKEQRLHDILQCKQKLTLANRLPIEILISIFEQYILDDMLDKATLYRGPMTVSHVCSRWRRAACSPTLWSDIHFDLLITPAAVSMIKMWLTRSQNTPLTIDLALHRLPFHVAMRDILAESSRWRHLKVKSRSLRTLNEFLCECTKAPAPQLRTIDLEVVESSELHILGERIMPLAEVFRESPHIHMIRIFSRNLLNPTALPASLTQLSLVLPRLSTSTFQQPMFRLLALLEQLPKLETLLIELPLSHTTGFALDAENYSLVDLLHLTSLTLNGPGNIFSLLPRIRVPLLNTLILCGSVVASVDQKISQWFLHLLQESSPPITHLALVDLTFDDTVYIRLFASLPFLETLGVHDSQISDVSVKMLHGPNLLCPMLKRLDIRWCQALSGTAIIDMVCDRSSIFLEIADKPPPPSPILEVTIIHCGLVSEDDISKLEELTICRRRRHKYDDMCKRWRCCGSG